MIMASINWFNGNTGPVISRYYTSHSSDKAGGSTGAVQPSSSLYSLYSLLSLLSTSLTRVEMRRWERDC